MRGSIRALSFYISAGLCLIAFFMAFVSPIEFKEINLDFTEVYFGRGLFVPAIGGFLGFIFLLPVIAVLLTLAITINIKKDLNDGIRHTLEMALLLLLFIAIILIFTSKPMFMEANEIENERTTKLGYGPLIGGLLSLFAFALAGFGLIIPTN